MSGWWRVAPVLLCGLPAVAVGASPPAFPSPSDTGLGGAVAAAAPTGERIVVRGIRRNAAPVPGYADQPPPWEAARAIRDPRTGASTTAFGNAFNLGDPLGSDERSNETGGALVAPRRP